MRWRSQCWLLLLVGCCLLLLIGCPEDNASEDELLLPSETEPTIEELGLRLARAVVALDLTGLSQADIEQVARGSYLVNGAGGGCGCHTDAAGYLAGGLRIGPVVARNLTPDSATGLQLTEDEFIESMRTGKDFTDSTPAAAQRLIVHPWPLFRFMSLADLRAIFAFLRRIPPVDNVVQTTFSLPAPPVPFPAALGDGDAVNDPTNAGRGLRLLEFFSSGPAAATFVAQFNAALAGATPEERDKIGRGSYLVNTIADCSSCHTDGSGDGAFDSGLLPMTVDVNTAAYLAGGVDLAPLLGLSSPLFTRNLTPDAGTGLTLSEEEFGQVLRFGADFRRPGGSLRLAPHFPAEFRFVADDLSAIYAYLQTIPPVSNNVFIQP